MAEVQAQILSIPPTCFHPLICTRALIQSAAFTPRLLTALVTQIKQGAGVDSKFKTVVPLTAVISGGVHMWQTWLFIK